MKMVIEFNYTTEETIISILSDNGYLLSNNIDIADHGNKYIIKYEDEDDKEFKGVALDLIAYGIGFEIIVK